MPTYRVVIRRETFYDQLFSAEDQTAAEAAAPVLLKESPGEDWELFSEGKATIVRVTDWEQEAEEDQGEETDEPGEPTVRCQFCHQEVPAQTAHRHGGEWVGDECCWTEQLRGSE